MLAANTENFDQLVLENSRKGFVWVDFWASWAGPSRRQQALLRRLPTEPDNPALPPMTAKLLVRQGRHQDAFEVLDSLPAALASEPEVGKLRTHLSLIQAAEQAVPVRLLDETLARDPADLDARFARAAIAMTTDDYDVALEHLAEIQRLDAGYRHGLVRRALLVVLDLLGPDDPQTRRFRQNLFQH